MARVTAIGRNVIIRKVKQETKVGLIVVDTKSLDENIIGEVMALPKYSYHPNGDLKNHCLSVGDKVALMRGKVGTTLPVQHIPEGYESDDKELWVSVSEEFILYKVEG